MTETQFNAMYLAHQQVAVQQLIQSQDDLETKMATAMQLATQGYVIDVPIDVWGWSPYKVMGERVKYGYTWFPSALMPPVTMAPGVSEPGAIPYDPAHPPPGAIGVSLDPANYPPLVPPVVVVPPVASASFVGPEEGIDSGYFSVIGIPNLKDGDKYTDPETGTVYVYHQSENPFAKNKTQRWFNKA